MHRRLPRPTDPVSISLLYSPVLFVFALVAVLLLRGAQAGLALSIGAALSYGSLWVARFVVVGSVNPHHNKISAISKLQLLLILKLMIFACAVAFVVSLGTVAAVCFLVGYLLVYSCLLAGAIFSRSALVVAKRYPD